VLSQIVSLFNYIKVFYQEKPQTKVKLQVLNLIQDQLQKWFCYFLDS